MFLPSLHLVLSGVNRRKHDLKTVNFFLDFLYFSLFFSTCLYMTFWGILSCQQPFLYINIYIIQLPNKNLQTCKSIMSNPLGSKPLFAFADLRVIKRGWKNPPFRWISIVFVYVCFMTPILRHAASWKKTQDWKALPSLAVPPFQRPKLGLYHDHMSLSVNKWTNITTILQKITMFHGKIII